MQEFHHNRARSLLDNAELLFDHETVQAAVTCMADVLNSRFNAPDNREFPLVLGVMGGAVIFTGNLLPQLTFPLEFDYIHVSRYGDDDQGGKVVWKVIPRSNVVGRVVIVLDDILDEGETLAHVKQRLQGMGSGRSHPRRVRGQGDRQAQAGPSRYRRLDDTGPFRGRIRHGCPWLLAQFA